MERPFVALHVNEKANFLWSDGFEGVRNAELEALLQETRDTLISLEAEFDRRQLSKPADQPTEIDPYCESLLKAANRIRVLERLDGKAADHVSTAVEILANQQTTRSCKVYQEFLRDVLRHCGPELVLLCAACLGKPKVSSLKTEHRVKLLEHMKMKKSTYIFPVMVRLVTEYNIPLSDGEQDCFCISQG